jgi:GT2 family glycosyltransferase
MLITASIVLYNSNEQDIVRLILKLGTNITIFLIDNSPMDILKSLATDSRIEYIHHPSNPGFGAAHNIAIKRAIEMGSRYHFIVNPDVFFEGDIINTMLAAMESDSTIGMMMPQVLNLDGSIQNLPKLLPTPLSIILRKLKMPKAIYNQFIERYELRRIPKDKIYTAPILSGCFTLLSIEAIKKIGMYDDKFFMYFEDWDLSRRMHQHYKTLYYPKVSVYHGYDSGANKSFKLFKIFIKSAIHYFNKWGWFFDKERKQINSAALAQFK